MLLSDYIKAVRIQADHPTKSRIQVDSSLLQRFRALGQDSETEIRELGCPLHWSPMLHQITAGTTIRGERCQVDWPEQTFSAYGYIGTVHTHPYRRKLGDEVAMGFSNGDFSFYGQSFPHAARINVHFVISNTTLYLAVWRDVTVRVITDQNMKRYAKEEDEFMDRLRHERKRAERDQMEEDVVNLVRQGQVVQSGQREREFYRQFNGYNRWIMDGNDRMIRTAARELRFELYFGPMGQPLPLKGDYIYLSGGTKGRDQRNKQTSRQQRHPSLA